jgi:hypothetical protein
MKVLFKLHSEPISIINYMNESEAQFAYKYDIHPYKFDIYVSKRSNRGFGSYIDSFEDWMKNNNIIIL